MTMSQHKEATKEQGGELLEQLEQGLTELRKRIGPRFRRAEVRERAGHLLEGLLADMPRKNG